MELFVEKILEKYPTLSVIVATEGIELLEETSHVHAEAGKNAEDSHEHSHEENGHVWMDVERYREQAVNVCTELVTLFPQQKETILQSWKSYDARLMELSGEMDELRVQTEGKYVVAFHEAFVYLAESLGMEVIAVMALDEDTELVPTRLREIIEEILHHGEVSLWIEAEYASRVNAIVKETGAGVLCLDPLVSGPEEPESYLTGMRQNMTVLREALQND